MKVLARAMQMILGLVMLSLVVTVSAAESEGSAKKTDDKAMEEKNKVEDAKMAKLGLYRLPLKMPKAMFVGTPKNIKSPNLRKESGKKRPPFYAPKGAKNLAAGKAMVIVADQHGGPRGTVAPFFGRQTSTLSLPAALIVRRDLPLFFMAGHRIDRGRHEVTLERLDVPSLDARGEEARRLQLTTLCNQAIERAALKHPDQYFWYHRRFRTPGDGREPIHAGTPESI